MARNQLVIKCLFTTVNSLFIQRYIMLWISIEHFANGIYNIVYTIYTLHNIIHDTKLRIHLLHNIVIRTEYPRNRVSIRTIRTEYPYTLFVGMRPRSGFTSIHYNLSLQLFRLLSACYVYLYLKQLPIYS